MNTTEKKELRWDEYLLHCRAEQLHPSYKDFLVWYQENYDD